MTKRLCWHCLDCSDVVGMVTGFIIQDLPCECCKRVTNTALVKTEEKGESDGNSK